MRGLIVIVCLGFLILATPPTSVGQEPGQAATEELEAVIEELQQRLDYTRQRLESLEESSEKLAAPETFRAYWKEGLRFETMDKRFKMQVGGRLMNDWVWWNDDDPSEVEVFLDEPLEDGTEFRRARLFVSGDIYERVKFKAQYDFAGGDADLKDAYIELTKLGHLGGFRVGLDLDFSGYYIEASYFITGEHRRYKGGAFSRVKPKHNFTPGKSVGPGAWQVAFRYSNIDLNDFDEGILGGQEDNLTIGLNWHINPNVRWM